MGAPNQPFGANNTRATGQVQYPTNMRAPNQPFGANNTGVRGQFRNTAMNESDFSPQISSHFSPVDSGIPDGLEFSPGNFIGWLYVWDGIS